ncbi:NB-ARC - like 10, partial [Theobroma cacao]
IANSLKQALPTDVLQRAAKLKDILEEKRYVLILDDVWKRFSLLDLGILEPTLGMGRKVVLTSRSIEVCKSMGCEVVKVQLLPKNESMNLFLDHVGRRVVQDQNLKDIVDKIVEKCGGLPLSIVTIAGSMKEVDDFCEWKNALIELEERVESVKELDIEGVSTISHSTAKAEMDLSDLKDLKMPNATHSWVTKTMSLKGCRAKYLQNYSYMAYSSSDNRGRGSGWVPWFYHLIDCRQFQSKGQDLCVRGTLANGQEIVVKRLSKSSGRD